ncbi:SURF1 family protein [Antribacter gilvus]|uniref:SURF1 family cytochrome oxidase biogenesis protein n=1 Tax=Antribacter gilvus TaxID=2304675 RepID=UPI001F0C6E99|nr:SURF1 family protein [Antribacter gilvus]
MTEVRPVAPDGGPRPDVEADEPRTVRQWLVLGVAAVLLAALCLLAGRWQWDRYEAREAQINIIDANWSADPVPVEDLLPAPGTTLPGDEVWQPVTLEGRYVPESTVLLRNRPVGGTPGYHVLVPFDTGEIVMVVDRGFVPMGADGSQVPDLPEPPSGDVRVTVSLRADEPPSSRGVAAGQVQAISTEQVLAAAPTGAGWAEGRTVGAYGALRSEDPAPARSLVALPKPDTNPGSHLSYAFQWCVFAIGAVSGYVLLWRRERQAARGHSVSAGDLLAAAPDVDEATGGPRSRARRDEAPAPLPGPLPGPLPTGRRSRRNPQDDEEDALIEAQLRD